MNRSILAAGLVALASPALAHVDPGEHGSFAAGMTHPMFGADHLLAMVAVGLLAATLKGRAIIAVPAAFVGCMGLGFLLAVAGGSLPLVEPLILASGVVIGGLVVTAMRLPLSVAAGVVGFFGLFHGFAHGSEMGAATMMPYALGFLVATALLHAAGVAVALALSAALRGARGETAVRVLGGAAAVGTLALSVG